MGIILRRGVESGPCTLRHPGRAIPSIAALLLLLTFPVDFGVTYNMGRVNCLLRLNDVNSVLSFSVPRIRVSGFAAT